MRRDCLQEANSSSPLEQGAEPCWRAIPSAVAKAGYCAESEPHRPRSRGDLVLETSAKYSTEPENEFIANGAQRLQRLSCWGRG